ncbi:4-hydroxythreonine-4-phosphate dehydrogenase 2 [Variovorax sp. PBL-H6]|uniref:4-hydroxythreonine-4-phosphate dehydrogenase PdxA n=1 Tax=Variovorax sp. PBL-H6 TaxID=434009 RepID=UPI0013172A92|nr:4-hydroxythreonine-4-phosphate dehydrogenase PdxA [Variovorax sp. PBL-H6]VTU19993.1 4-hydroxythreonine-4-phosphate dehydrogenase 2 [Variovorax sp. PBL-H6]
MKTQALAITLGDAAGIGPEIIARAFRDAPELTRGCFVAGDLGIMRQAAQALEAPARLALPIALIEAPGDALAAPPGCIPVLQAVRPPDSAIAPGAISALAGRIAGDCVVWAARAALRGDVAALVTAPLHKEALAAAGYAFPGHTELLQAEAAAHQGRAVADVPVRMMLANDELRTVLVSIHMSLRAAIDAVSFDGVLQTLRIAHDSLSSLLGRAPRIGVAGLNPHAGEGGLFGTEERDIIAPAIAAARAQGIAADGPHAPDTVFMRARATAQHAGEFDVVVAMYHDQGLIPVKYLGVEKGVNVTLGLPLVRTSPDHGTAFDIAGTGRADASSLIEAIRMARALAFRGA